MRKLKLDELGRLSTESFKTADKHPIILVADNIRSGHNIGSLFRTADAFAIEEVCICGISPKPPHKEINKTAIGATSSVAWSYFDSVRECIEKLKHAGYHILAVEQTDESKLIRTYQWQRKPVALILGNEVDGVSDDIMDLVDEALEIEQYGTKHSLNVSVCAGIALHALIHSVR